MKRNVALVLASGGARGIAHIGAIRELEQSGYRISSVAGTSMGALIGGIYASGKLDSYERWLRVLTRRRVFELADFTFSSSGILKGRRIIEELKTFIPDIPIENMSIPFTAVATDIESESEAIFDSGSLFDAVRASISIPSLFTPVQLGDKLLIDGGVTNPLPLDRVRRTEGDILVAVDVSAPSGPKQAEQDDKPVAEPDDEGDSIMEKIKHKALMMMREQDKEQTSYNYYTLLSQASSIMIQRISALMMQIHKPDILVSISGDAYGTLEFHKAAQIIELGRSSMREAIAEYESTVSA